MLQTALRFSHDLLKECVKPGDVVVDATMGNGHDTYFLRKLVGDTGFVYAFDIQEEALLSTKRRLEKDNLFNRVELIHQGHETIDDIFPTDTKLNAAVFNLGYLPRGDKSITTLSQTTLKALRFMLDKLADEGRIILVLYSGHDSGKVEKEDVLMFAEKLPQEEFSVLTYQFINQRNAPPSLLCIEKKKTQTKS